MRFNLDKKKKGGKRSVHLGIEENLNEQLQAWQKRPVMFKRNCL
jgi:hypothetical protein